MCSEIYLDNSATTKPYDEVTEYIGFINKNVYGNPSSLHKMGIEAERLIKKARKTIADSISADSKEIYFTSGGTESNNLAIRGYLEANPRKGNHIITTKIEHPSVSELFKHFSARGYDVDYIDVDRDGIIDIEHFKSKIKSSTALISIIYVNNETGSIQPVEKIAEVKNSVNKGAVMHIDAVQAFGKIKIYPEKSGIDMVSISSHKIHGPKGTGALYVDKSLKMNPIMYGGGQEALLRSGTENVAGICGFGLADEITFKEIENNWNRIKGLKSIFIEKLTNSIKFFKILSPQDSSPYILNVSFGGLRAETLLHHLEEKNIFVSTGSACSSRKKLHSHVLKAMGYMPSDIEGAVRFSFSVFNDEYGINKTIDALKEIVFKLQKSH